MLLLDCASMTFTIRPLVTETVTARNVLAHRDSPEAVFAVYFLPRVPQGSALCPQLFASGRCKACNDLSLPILDGCQFVFVFFLRTKNDSRGNGPGGRVRCGEQPARFVSSWHESGNDEP